MNQAPETEPEAGMTMRSVIGRIDHAMHSGELSNGDLAELRRISPTEPYTAALWKVLVSMVPDRWTTGADQEQTEERWAAILLVMATAPDLHQPGRRFGKALANCGYSELRFVRLLRARGERLHEEVRQMARFLASKGESGDVTELANLLLEQDGEWAEKHRRRVARDYYRTLFTIENEQ